MHNNLWRALTRPRHFQIPSWHHLVHGGEHYSHMLYLGLVSVESHYWYGKVAAVGLLFAVASLFVRNGHVVEALAETLE